MVQITNLPGANPIPTAAPGWVPRTGLIGAEHALLEGGQLGFDQLQQGQTQGLANIQQGLTAATEKINTGRADLSGGQFAAQQALTGGRADIMGGQANVNQTFAGGRTDINQALINAQQGLGAGRADLTGGQANINQALQAGRGDINQALLNAQQGINAGRADIAGGQTDINQLLAGAGGNINAATIAAQNQLNPALAANQQFIDAGAQAQQVNAAITGALGPEAQALALSNAQTSPAQQFLLQQGERAMIRNAGATGGLGGANLQKELIRFGQGTASQFQQQEIDNRNALINQGLAAAGQFGNIAQTGAGIQQAAGQSLANIAQAGAGYAGTSAQNLANLSGQGAGFSLAAGQNLADIERAGAGFQQATAQGLANIAGQGAQFDVTAGQNLADIQNAQAATQAQAAVQLADIQGSRANIDAATAQSLAALSGDQAALETGAAQNLANINTTGGRANAEYLSSLANQLAAGRTRAGELDAANVAATTSAIANLANQQGLTTSEILADGGAQLEQILLNNGLTAAEAKTQVAAILANIETSQANQTGIAPVTKTSGILGDIGKVVAAGAKLSDIRLKTNIHPIGERNGLKYYIWDWNQEGRRIAGDQSCVGVIAQEAMKVRPDAVIQGEDGYLRVNYGALN